MKCVCAWCAKETGRAEDSRHPDTVISHGICESCLDNITFQQGVALQRYLDSLPVPILVVDDDVVVQAVNASACEMLGKDRVDIDQKRGGDVFECAYARLPGGCGRTIHCSGCTIRRTVMKTHETGQPQCMIPATLSRGIPGEVSTIVLYITTVKAGNAVLLRVDKKGSPR